MLLSKIVSHEKNHWVVNPIETDSTARYREYQLLAACAPLRTGKNPQECAENMSFRVDKAWRQRCSQRFRNILDMVAKKAGHPIGKWEIPVKNGDFMGRYGKHTYI